MASTKTRKEAPRKMVSPYHKTLAMERHFPEVVTGDKNLTEFANAAKVHTSTASVFLAAKSQEFALENRRKFFAFSSRDAVVFNDAAKRQMDILETLNRKPFALWDEDERKLEKHALSCLKSLHPFLVLAASVAHVPMPGLPAPQDDDESEESSVQSQEGRPATLRDGL